VERDPKAVGVEVDDDAVDQKVQKLALLLRHERAPHRAETVEQAGDALDLALGAGERPQAILDLAELDAQVVDLGLDLAEPLRRGLAAAVGLAERGEETLRLALRSSMRATSCARVASAALSAAGVAEEAVEDPLADLAARGDVL